MGDAKKPDYFTTGGGRPFEPHPYESPDKTNEKRNKKIEIDLDKLNQPGIGPVDFDEKKAGRIMPKETTDALGKGAGDVD